MKITSRIYLSAVAALMLSVGGECPAQTAMEDFTPMCDSLRVSLDRRLQINKGKVELKKVLRKGNSIDLYFSESLGDYPLRKDDIKWLRDTVRQLLPAKYSSYGIGDIFSRGVEISRIVTIRPDNEGMMRPDSPKSLAQGRRTDSHRASPVSKIGAQKFRKGLEGRNIALWQSHGNYFAKNLGYWTWQRSCLFQTVEDLYTQSYVLPYLVPMLENAGAYVMLPRERDLNTCEYIIDAESRHDYPHRLHGTYSENGKWTDGGEGFGDVQENYGDNENPFRCGRTRKAVSDGASLVSAEWRTRVTEKSDYAVYVSYKYSPQNAVKARYRVKHAGGESEYTVNQRMGSGTWMYLGTFTFTPEEDAVITLDNRSGSRFLPKGTVLSADAVKIGGGYGNIRRSCRITEEADTLSFETTSGRPRLTEAARYWLQWAGMPSEIYTPTNNENDYKDDYTCRGYWVDYLTGGSAVNPKKPGKNIPIDLSLGFHTDAGTTPNDSIVGTLAIYTYRSEGKVLFPDGESRMLSRQLCDLVQSQIVDDIKAEFTPQWQRRGLADRSYLESRTPNVPAMLLELLSHQNFADMKYGLDPSFQFTVSRAVYKGILKFLSLRYSCPYSVQPLPVKDFSAVLDEDGNAVLKWSEREDPLEPTADAEGYILYTRLDDGGFDDGRIIRATREKDGRLSAIVGIEKGHIYSFRVAAFNDGGKSFPSETLAVGIPENANGKTVLVINNFTTTSGPEPFEGGHYAGFDHNADRGTGYIRNIAYIGDMYNMDRTRQWISDDNPGFGASHTDYAGTIIAGNSFDYPYMHGKALLRAGYRFSSVSSAAFCQGEGGKADAADLICGKRRSPFDNDLISRIEEYLSSGGRLLLSGSRIASDNSPLNAKLGYKATTDYANCKGEVTDREDRTVAYYVSPNPVSFSVESVDGISLCFSAILKGKTFMWHRGSRAGAAVRYDAGKYRAVSYAFPLEAVKDERERDRLILEALEYLLK